MKKIIALGILLSTLTACAAALTQTAPTPLTTIAQETLTYQVNIADYRKEAEAEDGTKLVEVCMELPELTVLRPDGTQVEEPQNEAERTALTAAETFNTQFQKWNSEETFAELKQWAETDYAVSPEAFTQSGLYYTEEVTTSVCRVGELLSVKEDYMTYTGGAHPNTVLLACTFDLSTGTFLEVTTLAADVGDFLSAVTEEILRQANEPLADGTIPAEGYWEGYKDVAANWTSYAVSFDETGMTVSFSPYELASYAAGSQTFFLPYAVLRPYFNDHGLALLGLEK